MLSWLSLTLSCSLVSSFPLGSSQFAQNEDDPEADEDRGLDFDACYNDCELNAVNCLQSCLFGDDPYCEDLCRADQDFCQYFCMVFYDRPETTIDTSMVETTPVMTTETYTTETNDVITGSDIMENITNVTTESEVTVAESNQTHYMLNDEERLAEMGDMITTTIQTVVNSSNFDLLSSNTSTGPQFVSNFSEVANLDTIVSHPDTTEQSILVNREPNANQNVQRDMSDTQLYPLIEPNPRPMLSFQDPRSSPGGRETNVNQNVPWDITDTQENPLSDPNPRPLLTILDSRSRLGDTELDANQNRPRDDTHQYPINEPNILDPQSSPRAMILLPRFLDSM